MTAWKNTERRLAALLGGKRVPVTGRQRGSAPDIEHEWLSLEVKHRRILPAWLHDAMDQAKASRLDGQLPAVILHEKNMDHAKSMVLIRLDDFLEWFGK